MQATSTKNGTSTDVPSAIIGRNDGGNIHRSRNERARFCTCRVAGGAMLSELLCHFSANKVAEDYLSGFNKTAVRKFMGLIPVIPDVAEIISTTTVMLECD